MEKCGAQKQGAEMVAMGNVKQEFFTHWMNMVILWRLNEADNMPKMRRELVPSERQATSEMPTVFIAVLEQAQKGESGKITVAIGREVWHFNQQLGWQ